MPKNRRLLHIWLHPVPSIAMETNKKIEQFSQLIEKCNNLCEKHGLLTIPFIKPWQEHFQSLYKSGSCSLSSHRKH